MRGEVLHGAACRSAILALAAAVAACGGKRAQDAITATTPATHGFFPISAGVHATSCDTCHGTFSTFTQFTCFGCHAHDQAPTDTAHATVTGYVYASTSCYGCHQNPAAVPAGAVHDASRSVTVTGLVPSYSGTAVASLSPQAEALPMNMDHATTQLPGVNLADCGVCHAGAASGAYFPGVLHSSLANQQLPQPTACSDCHAASMPTGFVGPLATRPARTPPSGEMKHDAVAWAGGAPTATRLVTADCGACHRSPSQDLAATWATGLGGTAPARFHASLAAGAQPATCVDCHANSRPTGVLASGGAALPAKVTFDHATPAALGDCAACHAGAAAQASSWSGGRYHLAGSATPSSCLPCHGGERPTSTTGWASATFASAPFDYGTNAAGVTHGDGQDCAACHAGPGTGAWGGTQNWQGGHLAHASSPVAARTCLACHMAQRPDLQAGTTAAAVAALLGFDHSRDGTGDCIGCHQATVRAGAYASYGSPATGKLPGGDWAGGAFYPGATLVGAPDAFVSVTELVLARSGAASLVTGTSTVTGTLYGQMLHVSATLPAAVSPGPAASPDATVCWHCHVNTAGTVTSYAGGKLHASLDQYSATPGGPVTPLPQPTACGDCHGATRPTGVVEAAGSDVQPMDHGALFVAPVSLGGATVAGVADLDCAACHASPGKTWADGTFHARIGAAVPADCTACHYPLMADAPLADLTSGTSYQMKHRSAQLTFQACATCHTSALPASTATPPQAAAWRPGAYHASVPAQPGACVDCHAATEPAAGAPTASSVTYALAAGGTSTNQQQWMNHGSSLVAGLDCARCHAADAKAAGSAWSASDAFHAHVTAQAGCQACHGLANGGGAVVGTGNNLPAGLTTSTTVSTAGQDASTGVPAGTPDQIDHSDANVTGHDCSFCHTQSGPSTTPGIAGKEWAQARFHASFSAATPLVLNATTGRCSTCHSGLKPGPTFTAQDHGAFTAAAGTEDCSACHSWPGTGTASAPNWLGASAQPPFIAVGGFTIPQPPAAAAAAQAGIANLPHPSTTTATGTLACSTCHTGGVGGKGAVGYDHGSTLSATNCGACHEAGSNLLGTPWNGATSQGASAGDTRPFTLASIVARRPGGDSCTVTAANHFYPVDCYQCHATPAGVSTVTAGTPYTAAWSFPHTDALMSNPTTCNMCHTGPACPK